MSIITRIKNILVTPKTEWPEIKYESLPHGKLFLSYVMPLALIPAVAALIGYGVIGYSILGVHIGSIGLGVRYAIAQYVTMLGGTYLTAFVINELAQSYGAKKDFNSAFACVAYAYTPMFVGGIFYLIPAVSWLASLVGLYGLYLLYVGLQPMMKPAEDKQTIYFIISLVVTVAVTAILSFAMAGILIRGLYML
jgi:hypothetical protein